MEKTIKSNKNKIIRDIHQHTLSIKHLAMLILLLLNSVMNGAWADVTYHVMASKNGSLDTSDAKEVATITKAVSVGSSFASMPFTGDEERLMCSLNAFYEDENCETPISTMRDDLTDVYATYTFDAASLRSEKGIVFSNSYAEATWMNIKTSNCGRWFYASEENLSYNGITGSKEKVLYENNLNLPDTDVKTRVAFIGDPFHFKIVSRVFGEDYSLQRWYEYRYYSAITITFQKANSEDDIWTLLTPKKSGTGRTHIMQRNSPNNMRFWDSTNPLRLYYNKSDGHDEITQLAPTEFVYHVKTPLTNTDLTHSEMVSTMTDKIQIPNSLKRKFVTYKQPYYFDNLGEKHYLTIGTDDYQSVVNNGKYNAHYDIYIEYEVSDALPFTTATSYADALANNKWYNLRVDNRWVYDQKPLYSSFSSDASSPTPSDANRISDKYLFAFVGDPYEIRLICKNSGSDYYIGVPAGTSSETNATYSAAINSGICTWELTLPESSLGNDNYFCLHEFGTTGSNYLQMQFSGAVLRYRPNYWHAGTCKVFVETPPASHTLTYQIINAATGDILGNTATLYPEGSTATIAVPEQYRRSFCNYTLYTSYTEGTFSGEAEDSYTMNADKTIYVKCEIENGIFTAESDLNDDSKINWKHVKGSYTNPYLTSSNGSTLAQAASVPADVIDVDAYTFALVGNPYDFRLISKKAGNYTTTDVRPAASTNNSTISISTTDASLSHWEAVPAKSTGSGIRPSETT